MFIYLITFVIFIVIFTEVKAEKYYRLLPGVPVLSVPEKEGYAPKNSKMESFDDNDNKFHKCSGSCDP